MRFWALTEETLTEVVGHNFVIYPVDSHASRIIDNDSEKNFNLGNWSLQHPSCV